MPGRRANALILSVLFVSVAQAAAPGESFDARLAVARQDLLLVEQEQLKRSGAAEPSLAVAEAALDLAWLSGDYGYFEKAQRAVAAAESAAEASPRTYVVAARLRLTLHQVASAREALTRCGDWTDARARAQLAADLAFDAGELRIAESLYRDLLNSAFSVSALVRLANVHEAQGHPEEAKALFAEAERRDRSGDSAQRAWLKLRRGHVAFHQGRWDEARATYLAANEVLSGWWLVEEHLAEVEALLGDVERARQRYASMIAHTGLPEMMDALAYLEGSHGATERASGLRSAARSIYESRLRQFPDAASGHALGHFLDADDAIPRALELAERQYTQRRNGESTVAVARARWRAGRAEDACAAVDAARAEGWGSAELTWMASQCAARRGRQDAHEALREEALRLNPRAAAMYSVGGRNVLDGAGLATGGSAISLFRSGLR